MKFETTAINKIILLENYNFQNPYNNIDYLNQLCIDEEDLEKKLYFITSAIGKLEKFHSYFHFEQSYFHLGLALLLPEKKDKFFYHLDRAIFQDHNNFEAKQLFAGEEVAKKYQRPYNNFSDYVSFASEEAKVVIEEEGYWKINNLEEKIEAIIESHLAYHKEAAKLYVNRANIFALFSKKDLCKNDLLKAYNLDNSLDFEALMTRFFLQF